MQSKNDTDECGVITRTSISKKHLPVVVELSSQGNVLSTKTFKLDLTKEDESEDATQDIKYMDTDLL